MRTLTVLFLLCVSLIASPPGVTDPTIPGASPVMMRTFSSQPVVAINTPVSSTQPRAALTAGDPTPLAMKLLVVDGQTTENSYLAITTFLGQIGVPYDTVVLSNITPDASGNRLDGLTLSNPTTGYGNYQGIILTNSTFGVCNPTCVSMLSTADWSKLDTYATQFNVRMVSYYTWPEARWGLTAVDSGASYTSANALQTTLTAAGSSVFSYLNSANPIPVGGNSTSGIWAYMATPTAASGETTTPLLNVGSYTVGVTHTTAAGEQTLSLTFDNYPTLLHSLAFNYGIINWVTNGVFLGSRQIYMSAEIDDFLMGDRLYAPTLPQCPAASTCPTMFVESGDLDAFVTWQEGVRQNGQFNNYYNTFAYVGIGSTWYPAGDPLFTAIKDLASQLGWISHTYSHTNLDCYTETNGVCNPATYAQSLSEIQQNIAVATTLGISIDPTGIVTPFNSGLSNANFLAAAVAEGIQSVVYPGAGPSPNTGYVDATNPAILEVPRLYTNLYDDVDSPQTGVYGSWPDEYNAQYGPNGTDPTFTTNQTYSQILDNESDNVLLLDMLTYQSWLLGFHISDMWAYDGTHSLYSDLMDATFTKYKNLYTLPAVTLSMADLNPLLLQRASYNNSGITGVYTPGSNVVLTTVKAATIPVTGACSQATCPTYGGQMQDSVSMAANSTVTLSLSAGQGITLASLSVNPASVTGGSPATGTVTLSGPAPSGGISIGLGSNNTSATVPSSVLVPGGSLAANFTVSTTAVTSSTTANITASYSGVNMTAPLTITPAVTLSSVSLNPTTVTGGNPSTGTVTLSAPAQSSYVVINLSSNNTAATVPSVVSVSPGSATATFTVTTTAVTSSTVATITASYGSVNVTAGLTINPAVALSSVSLNPTTVTGGSPSTGTVTLTAPAPTGGITVNLSSNSASATVPSTVSVTAGNSTATFTVSTTAVSSTTNATIAASYGSVNVTAGLTINPVVALSSVSLNPTTVTGGSPSTGTVTLTAPAPAGGVSVILSSNSTSAIVPSTVSVSPGSATATFTVTTTAVTSSTVATIAASYGSVNVTAGLTINPAVALSSVSLNPTTVTGGSPSTGTVTLTAPAPTGGVSVGLSSNSASATVPSTVSVTAGNSTATFTVSTTAVSSSTAATITASYNGVNKTASLTINPAVALSSVSLNPTTVTGGSPSTGTVTLTAPAPTGGVSVGLSSNSASATVPSTVSVTAGNSTATFTVSTTAVSSSTAATITASYNGVNKTASLTINPAVALSSVSLSPTTVTGGSSSTGIVALTGPAPAGGVIINLSSNSSSATVPTAVGVTAGSSTATFTVSTKAVSSNTAATITASYSGVNKTASLTITPGVALASLSLNPTSVIGGGRSTGTVTLSGPAPTGGATVSLSSTIPFIASVPSSVTIPAGSTTATFTVSTRAFFFFSWQVAITATYNGTSQTAVLTVSR